MLQIKKASIEDAKIISLLGRVTFSETFGHLFRDKNDLLNYLESTFSVLKITNSFQKEGNLYWLAYWNDLPVGYAKLKMHSSTAIIDSDNICQLQKIYVLNDFSSMRIGFELQSTLLKKAQKKGFKIIWLSVWEGNYNAIKFYEKNQFKHVGNHTFDIGKESFNFHVMSLDL